MCGDLNVIVIIEHGLIEEYGSRHELTGNMYVESNLHDLK